MNEDLLKILSHSNKDIDNQKLMDYLSGKLSGAEKHEVEQWISDNEFASDAIEGLQQFREHKNLPGYIHELNADLHSYLKKKKLRRERRKASDSRWVYLAIVLLLILMILAYVVIKKAA